METQDVSVRPSLHHRRAGGRGDRPGTAQHQCRTRLLQRQDTYRRHPVGGQHRNPYPFFRLVSAWPSARCTIQQRDTAYSRDGRHRRGDRERRTPAPAPTQRAPGHQYALYRARRHRQIPSLLPHHSVAEPPHHTQLDERTADRAAGTEDRSHRTTAEAMQRLVGSSLLCHAGAQLRFRSQWRRL